MATYTDNYTMTKPTYAEQADISVINANMDIIDDVMHSSQISLAPAYDIIETYNTGDIVMHELLMYKCLEDNVTGAWDSTKWTRTTAGEESGGGADLDIYGEASGTAEASFSDGAEASLVECEIGIVPAQDLHGYSKPWAGGAGKNKVDAPDVTITSTSLSTIFNVDIDIPTGTYTFSYTSNVTTNVSFSILDADGNTLVNSNVPNKAVAFTINDAGKKARFYGYAGTYTQMQLESGNVKTSFEPYSNICPISGHTDVTVTVASTSGGSGEDTTVSLGRTVYGGTLDVTTGVLTVDKGFRTYTGDASENWIYTSSLNRIYINIADAIRLSTYAEIQSNILHYSLPQEDYGSYLNNQGNLIVYAPSTITSASDWKTWLTSNNIEVVYELATPQTFNLTPTQVKTLLGQNYVSHDGGGTISLVYIKKDSTIIPNPSDAEVPLIGLEISGKGFKITDARIPAPPTTNGAYVLTVTVSGGTPTYSWENA